MEKILIHIAGPAGAGKTTFIERLLEAKIAPAVCVRAEHVAALSEAQSTSPSEHAELNRYREAGAVRVGLFRFAPEGVAPFYACDFVRDGPALVVIEGERPVAYVGFSVFVAPVLPPDTALLVRILRDYKAERSAYIATLGDALDSPMALARFISSKPGELSAAAILDNPRILERHRRETVAKLVEANSAPIPEPAMHWAVADGYAGIERARYVVVNVRNDQERVGADRLIADFRRIRNDISVDRDVLKPGDGLARVTAVASNLLDPRDVGLGKAIARVTRVVRQRGG